MEKYKRYTCKDFLMDEDFIRWQLFAQDDSNVFWYELIEKHPEVTENFEEAILLFHSGIVPRKEKLNIGEKRQLQDKILEHCATINKQTEKKKKHKMFSISTATVAAIALCLILSIWFIDKGAKIKTEQTLSFFPQAKTESIVDELKEIRLISGDSLLVLHPTDSIIFSPKGLLTVLNNRGTQTYNTVGLQNNLYVPQGTRFGITLADGSNIILNSNSKLSFPSTFSENKREIELDGQIYIDAAHDKDKTLSIATKDMTVEVLGTSFGVTSYNKEMESQVVLVSGSVKLITAENEILISPNQLFTNRGGNFEMKKVDVTDYISWKEGWLQLNSYSLEAVLLKISKYYGVEVVCVDEVKDIRTSGKLSLFNNIDDVLKVISKNTNLTYTKTDSKIIFH